ETKLLAFVSPTLVFAALGIKKTEQVISYTVLVMRVRLLTEKKRGEPPGGSTALLMSKRADQGLDSMSQNKYRPFKIWNDLPFH
ncbi:uncharacterized protein EI90DRAFT_3081820, partial [Cantharellus anzutake]|uniref:uncharacterized protein n=1 Tax=Cantharellus anzutake TaxID=1750568 RepID=UPI00190882E5